MDNAKVIALANKALLEFNNKNKEPVKGDDSSDDDEQSSSKALLKGKKQQVGWLDAAELVFDNSIRDNFQM